MANQSSNSVPSQGTSNTLARDSKADLTQEQVRAITDRVYTMLLRDLKQERERERFALTNTPRFKRC